MQQSISYFDVELHPNILSSHVYTWSPATVFEIIL